MDLQAETHRSFRSFLSENESTLILFIGFKTLDITLNRFIDKFGGGFFQLFDVKLTHEYLIVVKHTTIYDKQILWEGT